MPPSLLAWFALVLVAVFCAALAAPDVLRLLRPGRVPPQAGTAAVSPVRVPAAGETAVPAEPAAAAVPYDYGCILTGKVDSE